MLRKFGAPGDAAGPGRYRALPQGACASTLTPEGRGGSFGHARPAFDRWLADGSADVVKSGPHRTVYRVALEGGTVYAKLLAASGGPRAWARRVMRSAEGAVGVRERGPPARPRHRCGGPARVGHGGQSLAGRELHHHARPRPGDPLYRFHGDTVPGGNRARDQCRVRRQPQPAGSGRFLLPPSTIAAACTDPPPRQHAEVAFEGPTPPAPLPEGRGRKTKNPCSPGAPKRKGSRSDVLVVSPWGGSPRRGLHAPPPLSLRGGGGG